MKLMVTFSTYQSQVNYIPYVKYHIDHLLLVETPYALERKWSEGLKDLAGALKWTSLPLSKDQENDIIVLKACIGEAVSQFPDTTEIYFNIGGGQKLHAVALWELFRSYDTPRKYALYADKTSQKIEKWSIEKGELRSSSDESIATDSLTISHILTLYGRQIIDDNSHKFDLGPTTTTNELLTAAWSDPNVIEWLLEYNPTTTIAKADSDALFFETDTFGGEKRTAWIEDQIKLTNILGVSLDKPIYEKIKDRKLDLPLLAQIRASLVREFKNIILHGAPQGYTMESTTSIIKEKKTGAKAEKSMRQQVIATYRTKAAYFEASVQHVFQEMLGHEVSNHIISEAYANLRLTSDKKGASSKAEAEYDVVFCTNEADFFVVDAKTYDFDKKDVDARRQVMREAAGEYSRFIVVFPYFRSEPYFSYMRDKLKKLPFRLHEMKMRFYVLSENTHSFPIYLKNNKVTVEDPTDADAVIQCRPFQDFLKEERLLISKR